MHPRRRNGQYTTATYRVKLPQLISTIKTALGNQIVPVAVWNYVRLDWNVIDPKEINTNQRVMALFQFDPDAKGQGLQGLKLFYEELQFIYYITPPPYFLSKTYSSFHFTLPLPVLNPHTPPTPSYVTSVLAFPFSLSLQKITHSNSPAATFIFNV
jgi:hypothetical protein